MGKKIFCIGLNKTGTSSLHQAFKILGYKSVHAKDIKGVSIKKTISDNYQNGRDILHGLHEYNAFSDWDLDENSHLVFKEFYYQYPNAKFILNTRDLESWLDSREKHVLRNQKKKEENPDKAITWLEVNREAWTIHYNRHHENVLSFFKDKKNKLLIFDVTKGDGWSLLCNFLDCPEPKVPFPMANSSPGIFNKMKMILLNKIRGWIS